MVRHVILNYLPSWIHDQGYIKSMEYRPQIAWLPLVPNRGTGKVLPQEGGRETTDIKEGLAPDREKSYRCLSWEHIHTPVGEIHTQLPRRRDLNPTVVDYEHNCWTPIMSLKRAVV